MLLVAWKAVLSEAVVTGDEVLGKRCRYSCLEGSTSHWINVCIASNKVLSLPPVGQ